MASFAGFWCTDPQGPDVVERIAARLRRLPDDHGAARTFTGGRAALLARFGAPQEDFGTNAAGTIHCVFDGDLFNIGDVKKFVKSRARELKSGSNAELLAHLWEAKGRDMMMSLRGAFSFAIWDDTNGTFFMARDAMGHRPLYLHESAGVWAFSSELPPVLAFPGTRPALETRVLDHYMAFHAAPQPFTMFRGVRKLLPAAWLELKGGTVEEGRYWAPTYYDPTGQNPEEIAQHAFSYLFESVKAHTRDLDVPIAYLEGDPYSAVLAGLASLAKRGKLSTFSLRHNWVPDEARRAAELGARRFGSTHREEQNDEAIGSLIGAIAEANVEALPIARMAPAMLFARSQAAAEPGVMTAAGGELYMLAGMRPTTAPLSSLGLWRKMRDQAQAAEKPPSKEMIREFEGRMVFNPLERAQMFRGAVMPAMEPMMDLIRQSPVPGEAAAAAYVDAVYFLPELFLGPLEAACRPRDLRPRSPLADPSAVQLLVPVVHALAATQPLQGLRRVFDSLVPEDAFWKTRWATHQDWENVVARELSATACETLLEPKSLGRGVMEAEMVKKMVDEHRRHVEKHDRRLLLLYALELWHRKHIDTQERPKEAP